MRLIVGQPEHTPPGVCFHGPMNPKKLNRASRYVLYVQSRSAGALAINTNAKITVRQKVTAMTRIRKQ